MTPGVLYWRRLDVDGLERLEIRAVRGGVTAVGTIVCTEDGGHVIRYRWRLDAGGRTRALTVERRGADGLRRHRLERVGDGWRVDGAMRTDLAGAAEPDLSATPFGNMLPIRRLAGTPGAALTIDVAFIDAATLSVARSRQAYVREGDARVRYRDLGLYRGFEALLDVDPDGAVLRYAGLFERVQPPRPAGGLMPGAGHRSRTPCASY